MQRYLTLCLYFIFSILFAAAQPPQNDASLFGRKYREGETYRYRLTNEQKYNGIWSATTIGICELTVMKDMRGFYYDIVRWISMKTLSPKDTVDGTAQAIKVMPYRISLDPKGKLEIPKITVPSMTGMITDFHTFFVAISPQLGITKLKTEGDTLTNSQPVTGNFSNGQTILQGFDCLQTSAQVDAVTPVTVSVTTYFLPPAQPCLSYILPEMNTPVVPDTLNNFQMIVPVGNNRYNVQYGREYFIIRSMLRRSDGKLADATMTNSLALRLKLNCNSAYQDCKGEFPFSIERKLTLELLKN